MTAVAPPETKLDHTVERDKRPILDGPNKFKVAIFGANVSTGQGGLSFADDMIKLGDWDEIKGLAQKADRYGVDAFVPIARWQGLSGPDRPWGRQFETFTWAAGLAEATENIGIFTTCHVPFFHPLMAAKMAATVDHISGGRFGLNATAGYFEPEFRMFGVDLPPHDERYEVAEEWMTVVERLWKTEGDDYEFDFQGKYYNLEGAQSYPQPVQTPGPLVMSAGASPAGQQFAFNHANILFAQIPNVGAAKPIVSKLRANADAAGREDLALWAGVHIVCKDTEKEAWDYVRYVEDKGDWESAVRYQQICMTGDARSMDWDVYKQSNDPRQDESVRIFLRAGLTPLVGTPEMIAEGLQKLYDAGITGICTGMVDYDEGLDRMDQQIFPLMQEIGLRA
ncbi:LLM class flavin-dependent oxidoreductase [Streptomyces brevispora]|uniref:Alkanesulfonate monooxygenase SsuD/methylene tetrahydromethanopterin reductase-like flavin-dependent oxidoreductase (Luciferase family) n=1 Tax=Streptomyces brevispora TaxID=887462 RepID=A0A561UV92_9ACTN|nr:LLM class flavin-dependent oxidoreductase [Streptomyces brevispora]TWG03282.1 alkanesulfonate monooxygenase SsuD/methylene tetrahydromethanopterin reductase-like flavin-dependent oxidoreductase (luciferase family) [Streptomyces brevispora]